jgi:NTE family protein
LQAHRDYWSGIIGEDNDAKIPDLDVYIINVHPSKQDKVPTDLDGVKDRINDITFMDRDSHYDEMVANLVTDYTDLIDRLKDFAKSHFENIETKDVIFQNELESLLKNVEGKTSRVVGEDRKYKEDLLKGRFRLTKVIRIENESYKDSISGKVGDFTSQSIRNLIEKGKQDARRVLEVQ